MHTRVLTGITTSGTPHLGNYAGAIRPAIRASQRDDVDAFFFLADYHALIKCDDAERVARSRLEIAAAWLAAGLDPERVTFYRQSDIPEIPELCWLLMCQTPKGLMNRAHAYKAMVDQNEAKGDESDDGVTMGLFSYPVLMAADILMFNAHQVPVGRDQIQHLEMARDLAQRFNHLYGGGCEYFTLPEVEIEDNVATLPGLDGRKMSKSYNNTIPLFEGNAKSLREAVMRIVTDSRQPGEPKDTEDCALYTIYRAFAAPGQVEQFRRDLEGGLGWGEAKTRVYELLEGQLAPMRERYDALMADPGRIEDILQAGAAKARRLATPFMQTLRDAVGLRRLHSARQAPAASQKKAARAPKFVSFRDDQGQFRFRLMSSQGKALLSSVAFAHPKEAGAAQRDLVAQGEAALRQMAAGDGFEVWLNEALVAQAANEATRQEVVDALQALANAG